MSLLQNAVDSIALGIEDYHNPDPRRVVSCARNIFAGILLLFKHELANLSPSGSDEALIKRKIIPHIVPSRGIHWRGEGKKTVNIQQIRDRFVSLGISVDWGRVESIRDYRNDIEHYFSTLSKCAIQTLIADSFIVIRDFVCVHLGEDPLVLLGSDTWSTLTSVAEVYEREKKECIIHITAIDWRYNCLRDALIDYRCQKCGSGLIGVSSPATDRLTARFTCRSCGEQLPLDKIAPLALSAYYATDDYSSMRDRGDPATILCPSCCVPTYVVAEDVCVICEESVEWECQRCGTPIPPEEIDGGGYCGYCAHKMSKDE